MEYFIMKIFTTLNRIKSHPHAISTRMWTKLLLGLNKTEADDEPLDMLKILEINGRDCFHFLLVEPQHSKDYQILALDLVEPIRNLITNSLAINTLEVARRYVTNERSDITCKEFAIAWKSITKLLHSPPWAVERELDMVKALLLMCYVTEPFAFEIAFMDAIRCILNVSFRVALYAGLSLKEANVARDVAEVAQNKILYKFLTE